VEKYSMTIQEDKYLNDRYLILSKLDILNNDILYQSIPVIPDKVEFITRYILKKINENKFLEIDESQFLFSRNTPLYISTTLSWKVRGNLNNIIKNEVLYKGVIEYNRDSVLLTNNNMPGISNYITNYSQFYQGDF
jgi:hypothetical protein